MATKGMAVFTNAGEDYTINDPNVENEFSTSKKYSEGDYTYYQGNLYRFIADHAAGAWNGDHVTMSKLAQDLADLQGAVADYADVELMTKTGYITDSIIQYWGRGSYGLVYFKCLPNTKYYIKKGDGNMFACGYIKTEPAENATIYDYLDIGGGIKYGEYKTGDGATYIVIQAVNDSDRLPAVKAAMAVKYITWPIERDGYASKSGSMGSSTTFSLPRTNNKKNQEYAFFGLINSFSSLQIGAGTKSNFGNSWVEIFTDRVVVHNYTGSDQTTQYNHELTLSDFIRVTIIVSGVPNDDAKLIIATNGGEFVQEIPWSGCGYGEYFATSNGSDLSQCKFTWTSWDFPKNAWVFGDSYVSYSSDRWPYYLNEDGFLDKVLINGYPGETSPVAYDALVNSINYYGMPKYVVWCLGMNDGNSTTIEYINKMLEICDNNRIIPILATIPSVPSDNKESLNSAIRNSGRRFIDFAKAVGAQSDGTWYSGMLSSDNVHPTVTGAKALYQRVLIDFPEITH